MGRTMQKEWFNDTKNNTAMQRMLQSYKAIQKNDTAIQSVVGAVVA